MIQSEKILVRAEPRVGLIAGERFAHDLHDELSRRTRVYRRVHDGQNVVCLDGTFARRGTGAHRDVVQVVGAFSLVDDRTKKKTVRLRRFVRGDDFMAARALDFFPVRKRDAPKIQVTFFVVEDVFFTCVILEETYPGVMFIATVVHANDVRVVYVSLHATKCYPGHRIRVARVLGVFEQQRFHLGRKVLDARMQKTPSLSHAGVVVEQHTSKISLHFCVGVKEMQRVVCSYQQVQRAGEIVLQLDVVPKQIVAKAAEHRGTVHVAIEIQTV